MADLITAWKTLRGGCASSRLDHGFPGRTAGDAPDCFESDVSSGNALAAIEMRLDLQSRRIVARQKSHGPSSACRAVVRGPSVGLAIVTDSVLKQFQSPF